MYDPQQASAPNAHRAATWRRYLRFWGPRAEADVDDELAFHIAMRERDYMARGMSEADARRAATRRLGDVAQARAECIAITSRRERRMTRAQLVDAFVHDVKFAWRTLGRQKGWTAVAVITLALGIGANTAVFSVVNTLLLHPLPYPNADRVAFIYLEPTRGNNTGMSVMVMPGMQVVRAWKENTRSFEAFEAYMNEDRSLRTADGAPASVNVASVLPSFGAFTGTTPTIGRALTSRDIADGGRVALLSEPFWRGRYGSDPRIIGKPIVLDNQPYTVVGVMPVGYRLPQFEENVSDVWLPLDLRNDSIAVRMVGRLRPGVTMAAAKHELDAIYARSSGEKPGPSGTSDFAVKLTAPSELVSFRQSLLLLSVAVALVLLIACGNVAHLLLARTAARQRELAIRAAMGASRVRIVRQLLTESLMLAVAGYLGGILAGWLGLRALVAIRPDSLAELAEARMDGTALLVTAGLAALTGIIVGLLGTLQTARFSANDALKAGAISVSQSRRQRRLRSVLVVSEMSVSTVLLVGATLLIRSIVHLQTVDPGFDPARLYAIQLPLRKQYPTTHARQAFLADVTARMRHVGGVEGLTISTAVPPWRSFLIGALQIEGDPLPPDGTTAFVDYNRIEPDYFRFMGIRLIDGSTITDTSKAAGQVVVNAGFAKKYWPQGSALGRRLRVVYNGQGDWKTIVGVVGDALTSGLMGDASRPMMYLPSTDSYEPAVLVRVAPGADPIPSLRTVIAQADPRLPSPNVTNVESVMQRSIARPRFTMTLLVTFTGLALVLAAVGLYGVMAYAVAQQTREIGIRIALGATRSTIASSVLRRGVLMAAAGAVVGAMGARWASKLLESMLYGVGRTDPLSFTIGVAVLLTTALAACLVPVRRAVAVDPLTSIRAD
jgi:putative ABC transport system permease protein